MKIILSFMLLSAVFASAKSSSGYINFIRQHQQQSKLIWDLPVPEVGEAPSALPLESGGALFQLWTINSSPIQDYLLDQKLVGAYLPKAAIKITTLDPDGTVPRTRVDQPFRVEIQLNDLLDGVGLPQAASSVLLERHLANYTEEEMEIDPVVAISGTPFSHGYLTQNGQHVLSFPASGLTAPDPTKATGEEHFVIHALPDDNTPQTQLASAKVQVWPVASGEIKGITQGESYRFQLPQVELLLYDLYPRSDTHLILFEGTQINGNQGQIIRSFPMDRDVCESHVLRIKELESKLIHEGTYTLVLVSDTVYGREMLCPPVTFGISRTLRLNAMQIDFADNP